MGITLTRLNICANINSIGPLSHLFNAGVGPFLFNIRRL